MNNIEVFMQELSQIHAQEFECEIDEPLNAEGLYWVNVKSAEGFSIEISWARTKGFGFYTAENTFGEKPNEIYRAPMMAIKRLGQLHTRWVSSGSSSWLKDIRKLIGLSQKNLAKRMAIQQAAVSRLETRDDIKLSSLLSYMQRLDLSVEIKASNKEFEICVPVGKEASKILKTQN